MKNYYIFSIFLILFTINLYSLELKIYFTNDTNGRPLKFSYMEGADQGGMPARQTLLNKLIGDRKNTNFLLLDAGGIILGRPESTLYKGETDIAGMNEIKYDAAAVGINELMIGKADFEILNSNEKTNFYFLSANIKIKNQIGKEEYLTDPYHIFKFKNLKVGVFSVITEDAIKYIPDDFKKDFIISSPLEASKDMVVELKNKEKCDIIIALTHLGYFPDESNIGSNILASSISGINLIIDGRTGLKLDKEVKINNTPIFQAFRYGLFLGEIILEIDDKTKKINSYRYYLHPVNYKENGKLVGEFLKDDEKVLKAIKAKMKDYDKLIKTPIAPLNKKIILSTEDIRLKENELGNLICDALLNYSNAEVAFQNAGGIERKKFEITKIDRTFLDNIIKYDNTLVVVNMTGSQLKEVLETSMQRRKYGAFMQVGGIKFTYSLNDKTISNIMIKNRLLLEDSIYKVAINSWLAEGGDGYKIFVDLPKWDYKILTRDVVYNYIEKNNALNLKLENRINIID